MVCAPERPSCVAPFWVVCRPTWRGWRRWCWCALPGRNSNGRMESFPTLSLRQAPRALPCTLPGRAKGGPLVRAPVWGVWFLSLSAGGAAAAAPVCPPLARPPRRAPRVRALRPAWRALPAVCHLCRLAPVDLLLCWLARGARRGLEGRQGGSDGAEWAGAGTSLSSRLAAPRGCVESRARGPQRRCRRRPLIRVQPLASLSLLREGTESSGSMLVIVFEMAPPTFQPRRGVCGEPPAP